MTAAHARLRRARSGFTLIEVVVALSMLALIMLGLLGALRTFGTTATVLDARAADSSELRLLADFLRSTLSRASPLPRIELVGGADALPFEGSAHSLSWLGNLPARHGAGGMHYLRLQVRGSSLYMQYLPHPGNARPPDWGQAAEHLLSDQLEQFSILYQNRPRAAAETVAWQPQWTDAQHLPARIRIDLVIDGQVWPPLIVALASAAGYTGDGRITTGGGA